MNNEINSVKSDLQNIFEGKVFFYLCENQFSHLSICLAEGFKELDIPFYSNINYWQLSPEREEYLFCHNPSVKPDDCSVVVLDMTWLASCSDFPENLFHQNRKYITVYLDFMDGFTIWNPELNNFDFRLRTHYNSKSQYPSNCIPWAYGISDRILRETSDLQKSAKRKINLLANFRVDHQRLNYVKTLLRAPQGWIGIEKGFIVIEYPLRKIVRETFFPKIKEIMPLDDTVDDFEQPPTNNYHYLQWKQTNKRHYPSYYQRLKQSTACACFGGCLMPSYWTGETIVEWWDSWRFWESLAAGCATFHVDFEKYGIQLPVMPENWRHYIGIDLDNIQDSVERIHSDPEILERISIDGCQWAIENYGPVPTALRFLETISSRSSQLDKHSDSQGNLVNIFLPIQLKEINLIIFPDWLQSEESICLDLEGVIKAVVTHPNKSYMSLLIATINDIEDDVNLILSAVIMNLLMQEDIDVTDGPEISILGNLSKIQWAALLPNLDTRIILKNENREAIAEAKAWNIPTCEINNFSSKLF